jgi:tetratricopeptide (TPR) repeat protein
MTLILAFALATASCQAESKVRETIGALEKALAAKDESLSDLFDVSRLVKEMEVRGAIPDGGGGGGFRYRNVRRLEDNLATIASSPGTLNGGWNRIEPLSVRLNPAGDEAEALCRVTIGGKKSKFRFWLTRAGESWKAFDLENLDGTYRLSVVGLQYTPGVHDDEDRNALRDGVMTLQRGSVYLAKGQAEAARDALAMARRSGPPEYVMDWIDLVDGQALSALGNPAGGLKAADRVLARQKDLAVAHRLKASCLAALGEPAKAILAAKEYLKLVGDEAEMWALVGRAFEKLDQMDQAVEAYRKGADADAEDYLCRMELGRVLLAGRRRAEAASWFAAAARLAPAHEKAFENAADLLDRAGARAEALALSDEAALLRPDEAAVLFRRGHALRALGRSKEAEETLRRASNLHPDDRDISQELVLVLAQSGKDGEALERMRDVAASDSWPQAYIRAFVHAAAGRPARTLEELKSVLQAEHALQTSLAWIEGEPVFEKFRGEKENKALLDAARATREYWLARQTPKLPPEQMVRIARERLQAVPDHAVAHADLGRALRRLRRCDEAEASIRKAIEISKDKALFQDELGRTLAAQGKMEEALAVAEELIRAQPGTEEPGMDLRVAVFAIAGKREAALKALQVLLDKHPDWKPAATTGEELDEFRNLPAVQELLRKARSKTRK